MWGVVQAVRDANRLCNGRHVAFLPDSERVDVWRDRVRVDCLPNESVTINAIGELSIKNGAIMWRKLENLSLQFHPKIQVMLDTLEEAKG